jgi:hypothetical protein
MLMELVEATPAESEGGSSLSHVERSSGGLFVSTVRQISTTASFVRSSLSHWAQVPSKPSYPLVQEPPG